MKKILFLLVPLLLLIPQKSSLAQLNKEYDQNRRSKEAEEQRCQSMWNAAQYIEVLGTSGDINDQTRYLVKDGKVYKIFNSWHCSVGYETDFPYHKKYDDWRKCIGEHQYTKWGRDQEYILRYSKWCPTQKVERRFFGMDLEYYKKRYVRENCVFGKKCYPKEFFDDN